MSDVIITALIIALVPAVFNIIQLVIGNRHTLLLKKFEASQSRIEAEVESVKAEAKVHTAIVEKTQGDIAEAKSAIAEVVLHTNSMKDALVKVTGEAEFAKGLKEGQGEAKSSEPSVSLSLPVDTTITVPKQTLKVETKEKP